MITPLPKWVGALGTAAAAFGALNEGGVFALIPNPWGAVLAAVGSALALFSHSLTGTGGK